MGVPEPEPPAAGEPREEVWFLREGVSSSSLTRLSSASDLIGSSPVNATLEAFFFLLLL